MTNGGTGSGPRCQVEPRPASSAPVLSNGARLWTDPLHVAVIRGRAGEGANGKTQEAENKRRERRSVAEKAGETEPKGPLADLTRERPWFAVPLRRLRGLLSQRAPGDVGVRLGDTDRCSCVRLPWALTVGRVGSAWARPMPLCAGQERAAFSLQDRSRVLWAARPMSPWRVPSRAVGDPSTSRSQAHTWPCGLSVRLGRRSSPFCLLPRRDSPPFPFREIN